MKKVLAISAFVVGSVMAVAQPMAAAQRDRNDHPADNRNNQHYTNNFRDDRHDDHGRDNNQRFREVRRAPNYRFQNRIFGDRRFGYFDRRGTWCWY